MSDIVQCMVPELELFQKKHIQTCVTGNYVVKIKPLNSLQSDGHTLEFVSAGIPKSFLDVTNMVLRLVVYLRKKSDKSKLETGDTDTSVIDFPLHSIFSSVELFFAEVCVTKSPQNYPYTVLFPLYTQACQDALATQLIAMNCCPDDRPDSATHCTSWTKRQEPLLRSQRCELMGKLRSDFNNMDPGLYLLDNVGVRVRMTLNHPAFYLWTKSTATDGPDCELVIEEAELHLKYFRVHEDVCMGIERMLLEKNARYYFNSTQVKTFVHPALSEIISLPVAYSGKTPTKIVTCFVRSTDYAGDYKTNPFYFPHEDIKELSFFFNGVERKFEMSMSEPQMCTSVMRSLYSTAGHYAEESSGHVYSIKALKAGRFAVAVDFTLDESSSVPSHNHLQTGTVRIQGRLKRALDHSLLILVYAEFPSCVEINSARDVMVL